MIEWQLVCPDGKVRRPNYPVEKEAQGDALWMSVKSGRCLDPFAGEKNGCPGGSHKVVDVKI
jgi:hypothetical protein